MAAESEEKYFERKRRAVQYLKDNDVPKCFQKLLNDVVLKMPEDVFGYMVWRFYIICFNTSLESKQCTPDMSGVQRKFWCAIGVHFIYH